MAKRSVFGIALIWLTAFGLLLTACSQREAPTGQSRNSQSQTQNSGSGSSQGAQTIEVKVGIPLSVTGSAAFAGTKMKKAMELAVEQVNKSGMLGNLKFVPIWEDDQSEQTQAIDVTRKLAQRDNVHAIVGYTVSNICKAALPIANELKVPTLNADCVAADLEKIGPYIFRSVVPYDAFVSDMIDQLAKAKNLKRGAILYLKENDVFVAMQKTVQEAYKKNGIEVVAVETVPSGKDTDFSAQMTKIAAAKPEVLAILVLGGQSGGAIAQARQAGMKDTLMIGEQNLNSNEVLRIAGPHAVNSFFPAHWAMESDVPENKEYVKQYRAKYNEDPDLFGTNGYAAVWVMAHAIKKAGKADREAIRQALDSLGVTPSVFGEGKLELKDRAAVLKPTIMTVSEPNKVTIWKP